MSNPRDPPRLRQGLNPLLTSSLGGAYHQHSVPLSAVSLTSSHLHSASTPTGSAIQPYNPQEWIPSPVVTMDRPLQHMEGQASPPPPPPYSPPYNNQSRPGSVNFDTPTRMPSAPVMRPSPEPVAHTSFPPPPGTNGRSSTRERRFGLSSLRRHNQQDQSSPPDAVPPVPSLARPPPPPPIQIPLAQPIPQRTGSNPAQAAPGARRAVSTGAIETPTSARSRSASQTQWEPGMPLPPPPPGPPPASSRSQSVQSISRTTDPVVSPPTRRPPPSNGSTLGPVPPTPADWRDQEHQAVTPGRARAPHLSLDTASAVSAMQASESLSSMEPQSALTRTPAVRHDKTISQRRAESRTRDGQSSSSSEAAGQPAQLSDIVVPSANSLSRRRTITKSTPRSGGRSTHDTPRTGESETTHRDSRTVTPRAPASASQHPGTSTPPFSPHPQKAVAAAEQPSSSNVAPKALPTPPPQSRSNSASHGKAVLTPTPGEAAPMSASISKQVVISQTPEQFCRATIERYQAFAMKEAAAASDGDRVRLFADFIVSESRIRRERYAPAIGAMGSEIFDLTRDLFRPMSARRESGVFQGESEFTPKSSEASRSHRGSMNSLYRDGGGESSSAPTSAKVPSSPSNQHTGNHTGNNANWSSNYMPSLSPILSLSVSGNGDGSSRGRPPSRWWEGDSNGHENSVLERSKRESKYMSMPKEAREALQWADSPVQEEGISSERGSASSYPAEKTGWHDQDQALTPQPSRFSAQSLASSSSPSTPNPAHLDISRLITLPPPYPRHHPAVNNNHPELTATRTSVRQISDLTEVDCTKDRYQQTSHKKRDEAAKAASERRTALRNNLQQEINSGNMTFAEASAIEQDSQESEKDAVKELERADFEHFQSQVVAPLNELLTGRIAKATALFDELSGRLFDDGGTAGGAAAAADMPQEEGDDRPELLEKLTLLKWIFEARESLHRAIFDLLSDRNDRYRDVVVTPYRLANNADKVRSAEAFFQQDAARRKAAFTAEVLDRTKAFREVTERTVVQGVEVQLSAFWDIAPPLKRLLDKIPADVENSHGFNVQVPSQEYQENPSYHKHPMQYLFSLLLHTEKSTYQFIESQTNLLCLLHEVKEAEASAKAAVVQFEMSDEDDFEDAAQISRLGVERKNRADAQRHQEEKRLTEDLKEKVRVVQDQWQSALGEDIKLVKQGVGEWLLQTGGWDEALEEGGVGSV